MLVTQMFPLLMIIAPIYKIVAAIGLLNSLTSLIIVYTAFNIPFATFLMQSFFDGYPEGPGRGRDDRRLHPVPGAAEGDPAADPARPRRDAGLCLHRRLVANCCSR